MRSSSASAVGWWWMASTWSVQSGQVHVVSGEILWAGLLTGSYAAIVRLVRSACQALGVRHLELQYLPPVIPIGFVSACAFAALGLSFTALVPIFLVALPVDFVSATYFPLGHPVLAGEMLQACERKERRVET
jgi:hypothetical protein